jgi:membrane-associated protein
VHFIQQAYDVLVHLDVYLKDIINQYGAWVYAILFLTVFCETGLVIAPFLPGESLLITSGALAGAKVLNIYILAPLFFVASTLGDFCNMLIGRYLGEWLLKRHSRFLKPEHVEKAQVFYARYGGRAIIMARFLPVVRTLAPFAAGIARMNMLRFLLYAAIASFFWVLVFLGAGYFFGNIPWVQSNLGFVLIGIVVAAFILPSGIGYLVRRIRGRGKDAAVEGEGEVEGDGAADGETGSECRQKDEAAPEE